MYNELLDTMLARQKLYLPAADKVSASLVPAPVRKKLSLWMMEVSHLMTDPFLWTLPLRFSLCACVHVCVCVCGSHVCADL